MVFKGQEKRIYSLLLTGIEYVQVYLSFTQRLATLYGATSSETVLPFTAGGVVESTAFSLMSTGYDSATLRKNCNSAFVLMPSVS